MSEAFLELDEPEEIAPTRRGFVLRTLRERPAAVIGTTILVVVTLVALYVFEDTGQGKYHPARIIDGEIKPGYFDDNTSN